MTVDVDVNISEGINGDSGDLDEVVEVDFVVDTVEIDANGAIVVTGTNGETAIIPGDDDVNIVSANGDVWSVGEDGTITKQEGAQGGVVSSDTTNGLDSDGNVTAITAKGVKIEFQSSGFYHFDELPENTSATFEKEYKILDTESGKYRVPYKAISDNEGEDFVNAKVTITDTSISKDSIVFKTKDGAKVPVEWTGDVAKLSLKRKFDYVDEEIYAVVKSKSNAKYDIAASIVTTHLASEQLDPINVTLVPVGIDKVSDEVKNGVKEIYAKAGVRLNIQDVKSISPDEIYDWDKDRNKILKVGDSNLLSHYTDEEATFNNYIKQQSYYNNKTYYVFVTNIPVSKPEVDGFMPLKRQFGYVFTANANSATKQIRTMAHELGHGIFGLKHTWDEYQFPQGATDHLMDYGNGTTLNHLDWKKIHAPGIKIYWFQGDEDGEQATVSNMEYLNPFKNDDGSFTFVSMSGKPLTLPPNTTSVTFSTGDDINLQNCEDNFNLVPFGTVSRFIIDNQEYSFCGVCNQKVFPGYFKTGTNCNKSDKYIDKLSNSKFQDAISGLPCVKDGAVVFKVIKIKDHFRNFDFTKVTSNNYDTSGELIPYDDLLYSYRSVQDSDIIYVPAALNPKYDDDVIKFLSSEFCFCKENDFEAVAYGFVYATQLQKNKELLGCFKSGVPLFFYDENINTKKFHYAVVKEWQEKNINGFTTLKKHLENFNSLESNFSSKPYQYALHDFLKYYVPEYISKSNVNSYSLRWGTTYWESGIVLDKIKNISDNQLLRQFDDVFCLWESISFEDRVYALNKIADTNRPNDRSEEILLYLLINEKDTKTMLKELEKEDYKLFWKVWDELDAEQRAVLISYLNTNLINDVTKQAGEIAYTEYEKCKSDSSQECDFNKFKILPVWRANALGVIDGNFDIENGVIDESYYYLETSEESGQIHVKASVNYIDYTKLDSYWSYLLNEVTDRSSIFDSKVSPFNPMVLIVSENIKLNGQIILKKNERITVPAIFLHWLDTSIDSEHNTFILRVAVDGLVVASIFATGGATTPLLALDLAIFGTDFVIQVVNETSDKVDPKFKQTWDAIYNFYNIANIPRAVVATAQLGKGFITFVKNSNTAAKWNQMLVKPQYIDDYINQIKNNPSKIASEIELLDNIIIALQNTPRLSSTAYIPSSLFRNLVKARIKLANIQFNATGLSMGVDASVTTFSPYLKVSTSSGNSSALANIVYGGGNTSKLSLESVRWLPVSVATENISKVGTLKNVVYTNPNGVSKSGQLEIIQDVSKIGQFYLKEIEQSESLISILKNRGYTFTGNLNFSEYGFKSSDSYIDIIVHTNESSDFILKIEGGSSVLLTKESLSALMNNVDSSKKIRLLSCNSNEAAIELSKYTNKEFYASDGIITLYKDGTIVHEKPFKKYHKGARSDIDEIPPNHLKGEGTGLQLGDVKIDFNNLIVSGHFSPKGTIKKIGKITFEQSENIKPAILPYGKTVIMKVSLLKLMQGSISNETGDYFLLQNAYTLYKGGTLPTDNIKIWYNKANTVEGFWTVDHRRLASYKIGGRQDINAEYLHVDELMSRHTFKMTTQSKGTDIDLLVYLHPTTNKFVKSPKNLPKDHPTPIREIWKLKENSDGSLRIERPNGVPVKLDDIPYYLPGYKLPSLVNYSNIRSYLGNGEVKAYLSVSDIENLTESLKTAHPEVLDYINNMDVFDFLEMIRGYRDLKNIDKLSTFENALKSGDSFYGEYNGWLKYWTLTPGMKYSLTTIKDLQASGKMLPTGAATDIQLASIQSFTRKGDFINRPLRYENNAEFMGEYATKGLQYMKDGFEELGKVPGRLVENDIVFSGKAFSKTDFESNFVNGDGSTIEYKSFISTSKLETVAQGFTILTKQWAGSGEKVAIIQRIKTKRGIYIDDFSDWGKNLGPTRHSNVDLAIQVQEEVVLNAGILKQVGEPIPIIENGVQKEIDGMKAYYIDFIEL